MLATVLLFSYANNASAQEIKIGTQTWATKNLDVSTFRNGDIIAEAKTDAEWEKAGDEGKPAWCYYVNDPANGKTYGKLYNWYAVIDARGLAPKGWHVPSDEEWTTLTDYLGGEEIAGIKMKSKSGWNDNDGKSGGGNNSSGFAGLPGGYRIGDGTFNFIGYYGRWWSSTEYFTNFAWYRYLYSNYGIVDRSYSKKRNGFSVRCLGD